MLMDRDRIGARGTTDEKPTRPAQKKDLARSQVPLSDRWNGTNGVPNRAYNVAVATAAVNDAVAPSSPASAMMSR
jgi:hypothetical protein